MIKVKRCEEPQSLKKYSAKWTRELLDEIRLHEGYKNVEEKYKIKYKKADIRKTLEIMYNSCCCYCEGKVGTQSYGQIEHLRPRVKFPELTYDWTNLHLSCEICNGKKNDKWDDDFPVIDPTVDDVNNMIRYNSITGEYEAVENNGRGSFTISVVDLNRASLCRRRRRIRAMLVKTFSMMKVNDVTLTWEKFCKLYEDYRLIDEYFSVYEAIFNEKI